MKCLQILIQKAGLASLLFFCAFWPSQAAQSRIEPAQIVEAEQLLAALGYWAGPIDNRFDLASRHALIAFQKLEGRPRNGTLTREELVALRGAKPPQPQHLNFAHVEVDLKHQVLFFVNEDNVVSSILPISSGNGKTYMDHGQVHRAVTPTGSFRVIRKISGWRRSTLGLLYYPNYIHEGTAIHGSLSVPTYPASHGCVRIPMFAAREFSKLTPVGISVILYNL